VRQGGRRRPGRRPDRPGAHGRGPGAGLAGRGGGGAGGPRGRLGRGHAGHLPGAGPGARRGRPPAGRARPRPGARAPGSHGPGAALTGPALTAEARGLGWLGAAGAVPVPGVVGWDESTLVISWVPAGTPDAAAAERFGRDLARMHAAGADTFGAPWPGFIAS